MKFTPQVKNTILKNLSLGATHAKAANAAGVTRYTLHKWLTRGKKAKSGLHFEFVQDVQRAEARCSQLCLEVLHSKLLDGCSKTAMWFLESRCKWGKGADFKSVDDIVIESPVEEKEQSLKDILFDEVTKTRRYMKEAAKKNSWQAFASLQRQLLGLLLQIRNLELEEGTIDSMTNLSDGQLMDEITSIICNLPPLARQRIVNDLHSLTTSNVIPIK
jgi:hypothetical protein